MVCAQSAPPAANTKTVPRTLARRRACKSPRRSRTTESRSTLAVEIVFQQPARSLPRMAAATVTRRAGPPRQQRLRPDTLRGAKETAWRGAWQLCCVPEGLLIRIIYLVISTSFLEIVGTFVVGNAQKLADGESRRSRPFARQLYRSRCLSLAKTCSIRFRSGEYFGRRNSLALAERISWRMILLGDCRDCP